MAADTVMGPVHPGEILLEEFLKPLAVSQYQLANEIGVPARRINEIVHGQRRISAGGTAVFYLTDHQGSVRDLEDTAGTIIDHLAFDAFGVKLSESCVSYQPNSKSKRSSLTR